MVEDIEDFPTELESEPLHHFCALEKRPVKVLEIGERKDVPPKCSRIPQQRLYKWKSARIGANNGRVGRGINAACAPGRNQGGCWAPKSRGMEAIERADEDSTIIAAADQQDVSD